MMWKMDDEGGGWSGERPSEAVAGWSNDEADSQGNYALSSALSMESWDRKAAERVVAGRLSGRRPGSLW